MTPLCKNLEVTLVDDRLTMSFLYTPPDEPFDCAHFYVTATKKDGKSEIAEFTVADMILLFQMLVEALGYDVEGSR